MIPVVTTRVSKEIDQLTAAGSSLCSYSLMQRAAQGIVSTVNSVMKPEDGEISVICGKGNNGGDGYLTARILRDQGYDVHCYALDPDTALSESATMAREEFVSLEGTVTRVRSAEDFSELSRFELIIDALLGSGITGDPQNLYATAIEKINSCDSLVLSVDIPSGLNGDSGDRGNPTVNADITVVPGYPRPAHIFFPGAYSTGELRIHELGYDQKIFPDSARNVTLL